LTVKNHVLEIKGKSYPENTSVFYSPVFEWLGKYLDQDDSKEGLGQHGADLFQQQLLQNPDGFL
jgi:hypothetical protein